MKISKLQILSTTYCLVVSLLIATFSKNLSATEEIVAHVSFTQSDNRKMLIKVDPSQNLSDFREELIGKGRMVSDDIFSRDGREIYQDDEKDFTIRDVIVEGTLSLKLKSTVTLPPPYIAKGYEQVYQRFLNGRLIYKPNKDNDIGKVELCIADLVNPLEGTFGLWRCGDAGRFLRISTGYKKNRNLNNEIKAEIWLTPRFLVEREINGDARHFKDIFLSNWPETAPVGIIWTYSEWDKERCDYLTTQTMEELSGGNLGRKHCLCRDFHSEEWFMGGVYAATAECFTLVF